MKKLIFSLLLSTSLLAACAGCGEQSQTPDDFDDVEWEIEVNLEGYQQEDGVIRFKEADGTDSETGGLGILAAEGMTIGDALSACGYSDLDPVREGDTFEGWMEYKTVTTEDEDGFETTDMVAIPEKLYTTAELMDMTVHADGVNYVAKWAGIPAEDYFVVDAWDYVSTAGVFSLSANGGSMTFRDSDGMEGNFAAYTYWLEDGQTLHDIMGTEYYAELTDITKEGAEFVGWTLYQADSIFWNSESVEDEEITYFLVDEENEDVRYLLLTNAVIVEEAISTEELFDLSLEGNYFAEANWN